jgi:hypothetical protein
MAVIAQASIRSAPESAARYPVISIQIANIERRVGEVIGELYKSRKRTIFESKKIEDDARSLLSEYRYYLEQLRLPNASRDDHIIWLDQDIRRIDIHEDPCRQEVRRCFQIIDRIDSLGLDLTRVKELRSYEILTFETNEVYSRIKIISNAIKRSIQKLKGDEEISPLELRGLKSVTDELDREVEILSSNIQEHKNEKVNYFSLESQEYFTLAADRANKIAESIVSLIFRLAHNKLGEEERTSLSEYEKSTFGGIRNKTSLMLGLIDYTKGILSPSRDTASSLALAAEETSPRVQSPSGPTKPEAGAGKGSTPATSAATLVHSTVHTYHRPQIPSGAGTGRVGPGPGLIQGHQVIIQ